METGPTFVHLLNGTTLEVVHDAFLGHYAVLLKADGKTTGILVQWHHGDFHAVAAEVLTAVGSALAERGAPPLNDDERLGLCIGVYAARQGDEYAFWNSL
ncbi:hypothetical protein [Streptomyces tsukubensis]|uniref:hypothetical protein n=1 Tax=Streptomyces tsukubensis TaxID=83656 RepID=UPI00344F9618